MKFVHAADLHIDSPLRGLLRYEGAPLETIRGATRRSFENLIDLCLEEAVDLLLIAGDVHDDDWHDYSTGLFFASALARLREAGVQVVWIRGNHDAASKITKRLNLPGEFVTELSHRKADSKRFEQFGVVVHGQGFATPAVLDNLSRTYPEPLRDCFNIGLLHTSLDGREGHAPYAPCRVAELVDRGYDYWALGHVHRRELLHREPWVVFPGNLQGRHARETGPKGATLVTVEHGRVVSVEHRPLDVVRWEHARVSIEGADTPDDVLERVGVALARAADAAEGRLVATRVTLIGEGGAHAALHADVERWVNEVRQLPHQVRDGEVWVEKVELATASPLDLQELAQRDDVVGELLRSFERLRSDDAALEQLVGELEPALSWVPSELREAELGRLRDPDLLRRWVSEVERMIVPRLAGEDAKS